MKRCYTRIKKNLVALSGELSSSCREVTVAFNFVGGRSLPQLCLCPVACVVKAFLSREALESFNGESRPPQRNAMARFAFLSSAADRLLLAQAPGSLYAVYTFNTQGARYRPAALLRRTDGQGTRPPEVSRHDLPYSSFCRPMFTAYETLDGISTRFYSVTAHFVP